MNRGVWKVFQEGPSGAHCVEAHDSPRAAQRAMLILTAHELKNNRVANFKIKPPIDLEPDISVFNLPEWALEELRKVGL